MESTAVYGSDVMDFPPNFEGTKGLIHPNDLPNVISALQILAGGEIAALHFRLITTYGEVKTLSGKGVALERPAVNTGPEEMREGSLQQFVFRKEAGFLKQRIELGDIAEKLHRIGSWVVNKSTGEAWYSDGMYRIHNLPPQSFNAHPNTFHLFLHPDDRATVMDTLETAYAGELPVHIEYRIVTAGKEERTVRLVTHWSYNQKGQPLFSGVLRDLSEERELSNQAEMANQNAKLHQQVLKFSEHYSNTGYWFVNLITRKIIYSDNHYRIYGLKHQQLPGYNAFLNLVHPGDRDRVSDYIERIYTEHQAPETEFRIIRPDGRQRQLKQSGKVLINGADLMMVVAVQDITVQRGLEKKIAELNEKAVLQDLVQGITEVLTETSFITWYPEGHVRWSGGFYKLLGYKSSSLEPSPQLLHRQIHPDDVKAFRDAETLVTNGQMHDGLRFRIIKRTGLLHLSLSFHRLPAGNRELIVGVVQNITKELALHQKLSETYGYAETLGAAISDVVLLTDRDNTVLTWNPAAGEKTGIKPEEALYANLFDLFPTLNDETYLKQLQAVTQGIEVRELKARNRYLKKPHHYYLVPLQNESGETTRVLHVVQDVSRELDLQQQLSERLNFIESLVEASVDRIVVLDRYMNYVYWNKRAEDYYAISKQRVIGRNILEVFPGLRADPGYAEFRKVLRGETIHIPAQLQDGSDEYFETYLIPVKDESGDITSVLWVVHDLGKELQLQQEQRKAQQLLAEEHRRLKEAQALGHIGSFEWNRGEEGVSWSEEMYRINEMERGEAVTVELTEILVHPEDREKVLQLKEQSLATAGFYELEHRILLRGGIIKHVLHRFESLAGESGAVYRVHGTLQDITERKRAEQEILRLKDKVAQKATDKYLTLFNTMEEGFVVIELIRNEEGRCVNYKYLEVNPAFEKQVGVKPEEVIGKNVLDIFPTLDESWAQMFGEVIEKNESKRFEHYLGENGRWYEVFAYPSGDNQVAIFYNNITERKKAEDALRQSEEQLQRFNARLEQQVEERTADVKEKAEELQKNFSVLKQTEDIAAIGSWEYQIPSGRFSWSDGMYRIFDYPRGAPVRPEEYLDRAVDEDRAAAKRIVKHLRRPTGSFEEELRIKRGNETRLLKVKGMVVNDENGNQQKVIGVDLDITDLKKAEEELAQSRYWLEQTAKASPDSITVYNLQKKEPVYLNNCLAEWLGISSEELVSMGPGRRLEIIHPNDRLPLLHLVEKVKASPEGKIMMLEYRAQTRDGSLIWVRNRSKVFMRNGRGEATHLLSILQDVTEEKRAEARLKELNESLEAKNKDLESKNEEITSFAFVASHDLKEPLRKIHTFSDWLLTKEEGISEDGQQNLQRLINSVNRLDTLVDDILALTKVHVQDEDLAAVDLNLVLKTTLYEMQDQIETTNAEITADDLPFVKGAKNHLLYLFKNLLGNAVKFQTSGNRPVVRIQASRDDKHIRISFADNGIGFAPEQHKKIFQMFRRLHGRQEYDGTGMGLAICKKIMEKHGGNITAESEKGKGATFVCTFPA